MSEQLDAFPEAFMPSPRLVWLHEHQLATSRENGRWRCYLTPEIYGTGATEDEACRDFCIKTGIRPWTLD